MSSVSPQFRAFILDLLAPLSPSARGMFSGTGLFHDGVMFGMLIRDALYLRVNDITRVKFEAAGSEPFGYVRNGQAVSIASYYAIPEGLLDQPDEVLAWAREAIGAAGGAKRRPRRKR